MFCCCCFFLLISLNETELNIIKEVRTTSQVWQLSALGVYIVLHWFIDITGHGHIGRNARERLFLNGWRQTHWQQHQRERETILKGCCFFCNSNNNNNNNRIQRRFLTISSQSRELSPTRMLKWPERNRVQITCNTLSACHVQVSCYMPLGTKGQLSY